MDPAAIADILKQYPDDLSQNFEKFKELFNQHGPMCDNEGFYQHTGQCWADSIETLFLYHDGLKEIIQPKMASTNFDNALGLNVIQDVFGVELPPEQSNLYLRAMEEFLKLVQNRFKRHYVMELRRREFVKRIKHTNVVDENPEQCVVNDSIIVEGFKKLLTLHTNGWDACMAEIAAYKFAPPVGGVEPEPTKGPWVSFFKELIEAVVHRPWQHPCSEAGPHQGGRGGDSYQQRRLRNMFNSVFFENTLKIYNNNNDWPTLNIGLDELNAVLEIKSIKTNSLGSYVVFKHPEKYVEYTKKYEHINICAQVKTSDHSLAFLTCGNTQYIYDDNYGLTPYPYKSLYLLTQNRNYYIIFLHATFFNEDGTFKWFCDYYPVIYIPGLADNANFFESKAENIGVQPIMVLIPISEGGKLYSAEIKKAPIGWAVTAPGRSIRFGRHGRQKGSLMIGYEKNINVPRKITKVFSATANAQLDKIKGPRTDIIWITPDAIEIKNIGHIFRHVRPNQAYMHNLSIPVKTRKGKSIKGGTRKIRHHH